MEIQPTTTQPTPTVTPSIPTGQPQGKFAEIKDKFLPILKETSERVHKNKKLFWIVNSLFGVIVLLIVVGSIYKTIQKKSATVVKSTPTPTSQSTYVNTGDKIYDDLTLNEDNLHVVKDSLINYDPQQKRLSPPEIDFDISF